jgi:uncharacterized membrane protein YGL010W
MRPALTITHHLALYTAFHRAPGNRVLHAVCVPIILFTGAVLLASVNGRPATVIHGGTLLAVSLCAVLACVDKSCALALLAWLVPLCALAGIAARCVATGWLLPLAAAGHGLAWASTVLLGHVWIEPCLQCAGSTEDSNLYFRRRYFAAQHLGRPTRILDRLIQFNIAPLSLTHDALVWLGLRRNIELRVCEERTVVLVRLRRGEPPLIAG